MRAADGTLAQELHGMNASKLIGNLTKILTSLQNRGPVIIIPTPAASDDKAPSWFRANSSTNLTEAERKRRRDSAVDAEVIKPE